MNLAERNATPDVAARYGRVLGMVQRPERSSSMVRRAAGGRRRQAPLASRSAGQETRTWTTPATSTRTFIENVYDPDPADEQYEMTILYLIRDRGRLRIETDRWTMGLFSMDTWRRVLGETGFEVHEGQYSAGEDDYAMFACVKKRLA